MENDGTGILHLFKLVLGSRNLLQNVKNEENQENQTNPGVGGMAAGP